MDRLARFSRTIVPGRLLVAILVVFGPSSGAFAQNPPLFIRPSSDDTPSVTDPSVSRQQRVEVESPKLLLDEQASVRLRLELFPDVAIVAVRQRLVRHADKTASWLGVVDGYDDSAVVFEVSENATLTSARVLAVFGVFRIVSDGGRFLAQQLVMAPDTTETNRSPIIPFLEGTDVFWSVQSPSDAEDEAFPYKLEANIFPHLFAVQNFTDALSISAQERRGRDRLKEFTWAISGTPAVRIRMLREVSAPVRTPSYMPRGNFQFLWVRGLNDCATASDVTLRAQCQGDTPRSEPVGAGLSPRQFGVLESFRALSRVSVWETHFIIGHHSNGQDGCLVIGQTRSANEDCSPPAAVTPTTINGVDGSFSTNYFRLGMNYSRNWMNGALLQAVREARFKVEWEYHPRAWVSPDIVDVYGRSRLNGEAAYAVANTRVCAKRLDLSGAFVWDPLVDVEDVWSGSVSAQVSCFPTRNGGWGVFARFYTGQDYYNVAFVRNITRLQLGATFNQSGFFRFRRPVRSGA